MAGKSRDKGAGGAVTSPEGMHLGLRLGPRRAVQLRALVERANNLARSVGLPATVTPSSLAMMWITERLDAEESQLPIFKPPTLDDARAGKKRK